jgi:hypothetical protein
MEAVALGELTGSRADELRTHARSCALCRHELNWLESEASLFRHRAGRDEVAQLWAGVAASRGLDAPRPWPRVLAAMAAGLLLLVGAGRLVSTATPLSADARAAAEAEALETEALMSPVLFTTAADEACSRLPSGTGFRCEPAVPASFLASR